MGVVLSRSVFFHIGRTGGHWISHALWRAGLVEKKLQPLHVTPAQAAGDACVADKPFSFCFVRHPLDWAASVWRHEMEFGWREVDAAPAENFADFLRHLLAVYPKGPCTAAMAPFVDHCSFIGKLETLSQDLHAALRQAGETFDPAMLDLAPVNVSSNPFIRQACVAPHDLLAAFLRADSAFCERFGYAGVPLGLVGESAGSPWPKLRSKPAHRADPALPLSRTRFAFHLDDGSKTVSGAHEQRLQWALVKAVNGVERPGRTAVVSRIDPYAAHLLCAKPGARVTFVPADEQVIPKRVMSHLADQPAVVDFRSFHASDADEDFDTIMLLDSADLSGALEGELLLTAKRIRPGGQLLLVAPILRTDLPVSTTVGADAAECPGHKLVYRSVAEWRTVLGNCGFEVVEVVDSFEDAPPDALLREIESLAATLQVDPAHLLGKAVLSARRSPGERPAAMRDLWVRRRILDFSEAYDSLPRAVEARLLMLEEQVKIECRRRVLAEQGLIDRGADLLVARREKQAFLADLDFRADELRRAREEHLATQAELDGLRALVTRLGCEPEISSLARNLAANGVNSRSAPFSPALKAHSQGA